MNRRDFCRHLALLAAGAAALPEQIEAFDHLYEVNTRSFGASSSIISIKDLSFGFVGAPRDGAALVTFFDGDQVLRQIAMNTRGSMSVAIMPDCPMLSTVDRFRWEAKTRDPFCGGGPLDDLVGTIRYIDMNGVIQHASMEGAMMHM